MQRKQHANAYSLKLNLKVCRQRTVSTEEDPESEQKSVHSQVSGCKVLRKYMLTSSSSGDNGPLKLVDTDEHSPLGGISVIRLYVPGKPTFVYWIAVTA